MPIAVYPGSFDPITYGHLDVIQRAAGIFERVVVGVLVNPRKDPLLSLEDRVACIREAVDAAGGAVAGRIEVTSFTGLTVDFCRTVGGSVIVRGLRAISDFDIEIQLAHTNRKLAPEIDTVCLMTAVEHGYVSSSLVKEIARFGGDVSLMVPPSVDRRLRPGAG